MLAPLDSPALLEKAVAARPADRGLTIALTHLYSRTGVLAKAEASLKPRLEANAKDFALCSVLAGFYLDQKNYDAAVAEYAQLVADTADAPALNDLA